VTTYVSNERPRLRLVVRSPGALWGTILTAVVSGGGRERWYEGAFFPHDDTEVLKALQRVPPMPETEGVELYPHLQAQAVWYVAEVEKALYGRSLI
jgi:hypothetical protein